jgi:proteasome accessory factor A
LHQRIFGTECEYAPVCHQPGDETRQDAFGSNLLERQKHIAMRLMTGVRALGIPVAGEFLGNGGRLYVDRGGHPEYATPECRSVADLVTHEIAGDRIMRRLTQKMHASDAALRLHVYKNNVDLYGHTYGGHENYLITPQGMEQVACLIPFLVTRQIYAGAGKVMTSDRDGVFGFQISQRADFFDCTYSDRTSEVRGIINIRKREITRMDQSRRLHLIIGDSNMSQYTLGLKIATLVLMLRLLEAGALDEPLELAAPAAALKAVSRNLHAGLEITRQGRSRHLSALEIQSICLDKALQFYATHAPDAQEAYWLEQWGQVLHGLGALRVRQPEMVLESDPGDLKRRIDWILKLWLLDRSRAKGADEHQLKMLDLKYHDLDPADSLYERCLALDLADRLIPEEDIARAGCEPPRDTRAYLRGMVVQRAFGKKVDVEIENWERIRVRAQINDPEARHCFNQVKCALNSLGIQLQDPFRAHDPQAMEDLHRFIERWG